MADVVNVIRGVDVLVYVGDILVGGQQGCTLNRSADTLETTHKGTGRWRTNISGLMEWGIDFDGLVIEDDPGYEALEQAFMNSETVNAEMRMPSGKIYTGALAITDFPIEAGFEDLVTYSVTMEGASGLIDANGVAASNEEITAMFKTESKIKGGK